DQGAQHGHLCACLLPLVLPDLGRRSVTQYDDLSAHVESCQIVSLESRKRDSVADEVDLCLDVFITTVRRHHEEIRAKFETLITDRERWLRHELCLSELDWLQIGVVYTEWL